MTDYSELKRLAECAVGLTDVSLAPDVVLALIAENDEFKAVAAQPASLSASPASDYEVLKRQFFALRNYALCKDKLSGYYSRELEKLRSVDRAQSAGEIDAERDINEQLTNDLLAAEAENERLRNEAADALAVNRTIRQQLECYVKDAERYRWLRINNYYAHVQVMEADGSMPFVYAEEMDASIDAAISNGGRTGYVD